MYKIPENKRRILEDLIKGYNETMLLTYIQGHMGTAYADDIGNPKSAKILVGDFCFFVGELNKELVESKEGMKENFAIMTSNNEKWNDLIEEVYKNTNKKITRYAIKKEKDIFDRAYLEKIVENLDSKYEMKLIDEEIYDKVMREDWSKDLCAQFNNKEDFCKRGLGFVALENNKVIAGASSYSAYNEGIEIEIDTKKEYRRKGLALACGAKLILECLDRNLYPSWDAHNLVSVALSEKLGYNFDYEYIAYEVWW
ncbi:MAG: GNAT family N-acetyltransferase [Sarcina sp.]